MATQKTLPTAVTVESFINTIQDTAVRNDTRQLVNIMEEITTETATMWGTGIIGFGKYHYKYESGHEGDSCKIGFAPRKDKFSLYLSCQLDEYLAKLETLGKHKKAKGCLYIKKLADVDINVLKDMIKIAYRNANNK